MHLMSVLMLNIQLMLYFVNRELHYIVYVHDDFILSHFFLLFDLSISLHFNLRVVISQILCDVLDQDFANWDPPYLISTHDLDSFFFIALLSLLLLLDRTDRG